MSREPLKTQTLEEYPGVPSETTGLYRTGETRQKNRSCEVSDQGEEEEIERERGREREGGREGGRERERGRILK